MAKIVIQHDVDLSIGITLEPAPNGIEGWFGTCTECGRPMHKWSRIKAIEAAQRHVDAHEAVVIGSH